ncbi:MFS-type transporter SLC18B1-like isoform X1 [Erpetoichthys calabaricus]|uniref:MFS-type transporter SLC18B1-like isoform X1 n=1 Tax=Erpetoichthys calabaricus TaxID=27687 RepID=UPI002234B9F6|nr:MFS-type transporter SLC18B1-like isoform X1 [Erpetoichthys calabaricus]
MEEDEIEADSPVGAEDSNGDSTERKPNMSRQEIFTLISTASVNFSAMICYSILGPFFPKEAEQKGVSETVIGLIFGCFALCDLLGSLVLGKFIVQIGAKFMLCAGLFLSGGCTILFGLLDKIPNEIPFILMCIIIRSIDAVGFAASMTSSFAIIAKAFPNNIATVLGCLEIFSGLGLILGPPLGGFLYQSFGYEIPFIVLGLVLILMVPLNIYVLPSYDATPSSGSFWRLFTQPKVLLLCFLLFSMSSCLSFLDPSISLFVIEKFNLPVGHVGLVFLGLELSYCLSSPLLGIVSDKMPKSRIWFMVIGGIATALVYCFLGPAPFLHLKSQLWLFVLMLALLGFSISMTCIPTLPEIFKCSYEHGFPDDLSTLGIVSGMYGAVWSSGNFFGPTLGGFLVEKFNFEWAAAAQGGLVFISVLLLGTYYFAEPCFRRPAPSSIEESEERAPLLSNHI